MVNSCRLINQTKQTEVVPNLTIANTMFARGKGLLGRKDVPHSEALLIERCNSIHTFGMNFAIDCVFVTNQLKVVSIFRNVKPWRLVWPQWRASKVIEFSADHPNVKAIEVGDQLHVGT